MIGQRLAHYEITAKGEVWRATDSKLGIGRHLGRQDLDRAEVVLDAIEDEACDPAWIPEAIVQIVDRGVTSR